MLRPAATDTIIAVAWLAATLGGAHVIDHFVNPDRHISAGAFISGSLAWAGLTATLLLAYRNSRFAPYAAVITGLFIAIGLVAAHALPDWGPLGHWFQDLAQDGLSLTLVVISIVAGLLLAAAGRRALRRAREMPVTRIQSSAWAGGQR